MFNNPYMYSRYIPNMYSGMPIRMAATRGASGGLFSRLGSAFSGLKNFNWGGLINNASKTIGVINQTIPLVKQAGPMVRNMRSVLKVASVFKDETDNKVNTKTTNNQTINNKKETTINTQNQTYDNISNFESNSSSNMPVFFVN